MHICPNPGHSVMTKSRDELVNVFRRDNTATYVFCAALWIAAAVVFVVKF